MSRRVRAAVIASVVLVLAVACEVPRRLDGFPPGASGTADAVNDAGTIAGTTGRSAFLLRPGEAVTDLGTIGDASAVVQAVNEHEVVVGWTSITVNEATTPRPFRWTAAAGMVQLGGLPGGSGGIVHDVNEHGVAVGWATEGGAPGNGLYQRAVVWDPDGTAPRVLPTPAGLYGPTAEAINDAGEIVGYAARADGSVQAVLWPATASGPVLLGPEVAQANDINASGTIVGRVRHGAFGYRAARFDAACRCWRDLGTLGDDFGAAEAVNDAGVIVGGDSVGAATHAFRWDPATGTMTDIGTLGGPISRALDLNTAGVAVGFSEADAGSRTFYPVRWDAPAG